MYKNASEVQQKLKRGDISPSSLNEASLPRPDSRACCHSLLSSDVSGCNWSPERRQRREEEDTAEETSDTVRLDPGAFVALSMKLTVTLTSDCRRVFVRA